VDDDDARGPAAGDGCPQRTDGELRGHPLVQCVADDPVAEQVFDQAAVELALGGGVLGDVGDPHLVRPSSGEVALQVVGRKGHSLLCCGTY